MRLKRQSGFSMLELLVAMMIIAVIATLGFKQYTKYSAQARYLKAHDTLEIVSSALDQYFIKHGRYPDFSSYESMIDANSVLVKENMIPVNVPARDPWGEAFEGKSDKGYYTLKCAGDPTPGGAADRPAFTHEPGKIPGQEAEQGATAAPGAAKETK
jgi:prepilin-type N-terminal cleavage/methylation domain-containing protein